jgi:hypothetical protein
MKGKDKKILRKWVIGSKKERNEEIMKNKEDAEREEK